MMRSESHWRRAALGALVVLSMAGSASGQGPVGHPVGQSLEEGQFTAFPGLPECTPGSVKSGDPAKGPSIILARADTGCTVPWHWHSPNEHLLMVEGVARVDLKSGEPITLRAGGYAMLPSRHVHRFVCARACVFFVHSDAALDIHYVDDRGEEISPAEALKGADGTAAKGKR